jgi:hypothetical protein
VVIVLAGRNIMASDESLSPVLDDIRVHVKFKLFALWSSVMFCYIYGDFFGLFKTGALQAIISGRTPVGAISEGVLLGMSVSVAIPSVMVFLSLVLPPRLNRWMNIILGAAYTVIMIVTMRGNWYFYIFLGFVEITLTGLIVYYAWTWPKQRAR